MSNYAENTAKMLDALFTPIIDVCVQSVMVEVERWYVNTNSIPRHMIKQNLIKELIYSSELTQWYSREAVLGLVEAKAPSSDLEAKSRENKALKILDQAIANELEYVNNGGCTGCNNHNHNEAYLKLKTANIETLKSVALVHKTQSIFSKHITNKIWSIKDLHGRFSIINEYNIDIDQFFSIYTSVLMYKMESLSSTYK